MLLFYKFNDFVVDLSLSLSRTCKRGITAEVLVCDSLKSNHIEILVHTVAGDHGTGKAGCLLDIIGSTGCNGAKDDFLCGTAACESGNLVLDFFFAHQIMIAFIHLHSVTKGAGSSWDNSDLLNRCGIGLLGSNERMADLMIGNNQLLLIRENSILLLISGNDSFNTFFKVRLSCKTSVVTDGTKCGFIDNVRKLGTGSTGSHAGNLIKIDIVRKTDFLGMNLQNLFTAL